MSSFQRRNMVDRVVGACLSLMAGAVALYVSVRLIEAVWMVLLVVLGVGALLALGVMLLRARNRGW